MSYMSELCEKCGNDLLTYCENLDGVCEKCLHAEETEYLAMEEDAKWESLVDEAEFLS